MACGMLIYTLISTIFSLVQYSHLFILIIDNKTENMAMHYKYLITKKNHIFIRTYDIYFYRIYVVPVCAVIAFIYIY